MRTGCQSDLLSWYWHLTSHRFALATIIGMSWMIALPEYALAVPANPIGHISNGGSFTAPQPDPDYPSYFPTFLPMSFTITVLVP